MSTLRIPEWLKTPVGVVVATLAAIFLFALCAPLWAEGLKDAKGPAAQAIPEAPVQPRSWSGVYVSAAGGYSNSNTEISAGPFSLDGISAHGTVYGLGAGADYQFKGSALVGRLRGGYDWSNVEFSVNPGIFQAGFKEGWYGDVGLGIALGTAMPYLMVGMTEMQTQASIGGTAIPTPDLKGTRFTAGVEFRSPKIAGAMFQPTFALEATYIDYKDQTFGPVTFAPDETRVMGRVNRGFKALGLGN